MTMMEDSHKMWSDDDYNSGTGGCHEENFHSHLHVKVGMRQL